MLVHLAGPIFDFLKNKIQGAHHEEQLAWSTQLPSGPRSKASSWPSLTPTPCTSCWTKRRSQCGRTRTMCTSSPTKMKTWSLAVIEVSMLVWYLWCFRDQRPWVRPMTPGEEYVQLCGWKNIYWVTHCSFSYYCHKQICNRGVGRMEEQSSDYTVERGWTMSVPKTELPLETMLMSTACTVTWGLDSVSHDVTEGHIWLP